MSAKAGPGATEYPIDENGFLTLTLTPSETPRQVKAHLSSRYSESSPLVSNVLPLLTIEGSDGKTLSAPQSADFDISLPPDGRFSLKINKARNNQSYADFALDGGRVDVSAVHRQLIVGETQIIGRSRQTQFPRAVDYRDVMHPTVDQHTHLSAQITSAELIAIGLKHHLRYPLSILDKLGIACPKEPPEIFGPTPRYKFAPYAKENEPDHPTEPGVLLSALGAPSIQALKNAMALTPEAQSTPEDMEKAYYHREPFTKNLDLLPDILHKIAESYKAQGIQYAELSSNAVLDPKWLAKVHEVMADPSMDPAVPGNVMIRFRVGFPRNFGEDAFAERVEKYKRIGSDPFIAGPDILGVELNKTLHMKEHLDELARWMKQNTPEDSIQIHAGENGKNPANLREAIEFAHEHDIRVLVGHAIYGINDKTMELAKDVATPKEPGKLGNLIVQFNFVSNLAGGNIIYPHDVDVSEFFRNDIPCLNNSDGAGVYYANAAQTAKMAVHCGFKPEHFKAVAETEKKLIEEQRGVFFKKARQLQETYPSIDDFFTAARTPFPVKEKKQAAAVTVDAELRGVKESDLPQEIRKAIETRRPLFFGGAGGSGWEEMDADRKKEFIAGFKMLLEHLDPEKTYFLKGRTKVTGGIGEEMVNAVEKYNDAHPDKKFLIGTLLAQSESTDNHGKPGNFTLALPCSKMSLPSAIAKVLKEKKGAAFFINGKQITINLINEFNKQAIPFGLMDDEDHHETGMWKSASASMARVFREEEKPKHFETAGEMVAYIHGLDALADLFHRAPEEKDLARMYKLIEPGVKSQLDRSRQKPLGTMTDKETVMSF